MEMNVRERDGVTVVTLAGELKAKEAQDAKERLLELMAAGKINIVLDLGAVEFMTSAGLGLIGVTHKNLMSRGGRLVLLNTRQRILDILSIAKLQDILHFSTTEDDAVQMARA